jgi:hypothetical protein
MEHYNYSTYKNYDTFIFHAFELEKAQQELIDWLLENNNERQLVSVTILDHIVTLGRQFTLIIIHKEKT